MANPTHPTVQVVVFANPTSGDGRAAEYLGALGKEPTVFQLHKCGAHVTVRAYDVREGPSGAKPGMQLLLALTQEGGAQPVRVLAAGGDGTVMWVISEMVKTGVDTNRVAVGHIPFGTGNDFARSTGWGRDAPDFLIGDDMRYLQRDIRRWVMAKVAPFDVWEVEMTTAVSGGFLFVHGTEKGFTEEDKARHGLLELQPGQWRMTKPMVNYFSFGSVDRMGLGFEKRRTRSRLGNELRYAFEGVKKLTLRPAPLVSDVLSTLTVVQAETSIRRIPFASPVSSQYGELLFLNVPSFAGGATPWAWATTAPGCEALLSQHPGDGRLEVMTYRSGLDAALDAANAKVRLPGRGKGLRVASCSGPFMCDFLDPSLARYTSNDGRVYFQVDGEFFVIRHPKQVVVRHQRKVQVMYGPIWSHGCCGCFAFV